MYFHPGGSTTSSPLPFAVEPNGTLAKEGQDFRLESTVVSLHAGQSEAEVVLVIVDDPEPEGQEVFFIYLSNPEGGVQITDSPDQQGFGAFSKIIILGKIKREKSLFSRVMYIPKEYSLLSIHHYYVLLQYMPANESYITCSSVDMSTWTSSPPDKNLRLIPTVSFGSLPCPNQMGPNGSIDVTLLSHRVIQCSALLSLIQFYLSLGHCCPDIALQIPFRASWHLLIT